MPLSDPRPGLVIRYSYLWRDEARRGQEESAKDRPCVIMGVRLDEDGNKVVLVSPITHTPPRDPADAVEIPESTKRRLGLDDRPSWVVMNEVNRFRWPGPDLRPIDRGKRGEVGYGHLPRGLHRLVRDRIIEAARKRALYRVDRD